MGRVWLACCPLDQYAYMRAELCARDAGARLLRFGEMDEFEEFASSMPQANIGAALYVRVLDAEAERAVGELARLGCASEIIVFSRELDPGIVARVFYAGATEVIAAKDGESETRLNCEARSERGPDATGDVRLGGDDGRQGASIAGVCDTPSEPLAGHEGMTLGGEAGSSSIDGRPAPPPSDGVRPSVHRGRGAPLVTFISGRGGVGKTTLAVEFALCAAKWGLRAALVDLDLMFGNAAALLGVNECADLGELLGDRDGSFDRAVERTAMRVAPGLTVWGPLALPEQAELMAAPVERLLDVLRAVADVVFIDTSAFWGDAVGMAVASSDRCLIVGSGSQGVAPAVRAMELAVRLGVPKTRMTSLFNRLGAPGCGEEHAMRFEMGTALQSRMRVVDAGSDMAAAADFGRVTELFGANGPHVRSVEACVGRLLREMGCPVDTGDQEASVALEERPRVRLPWGRRVGERP